MTLLSNLVSSGKNRKRVGRGGSRGGTSGRGHKGQSARSGGSVGAAFEGGQMPLTRRLPKRGFSNASFKLNYQVVQLERINNAFDANATVTKQDLYDRGIIKSTSKLVKILSGGQLDKKFTIYADAFSKSAAQTIASQGGKAHKAGSDNTDSI